jgi:hypothetical protein
VPQPVPLSALLPVPVQLRFLLVPPSVPQVVL